MANYLSIEDLENYRLPWESSIEWELRSKFLMAHRNNYPEDRLICLSQVFANVEFLGCSYPEPVMKEIADLSVGIVEDYRMEKLKQKKINFVKAEKEKEKSKMNKRDKSTGKNLFINFVASTDNKDNNFAREKCKVNLQNPSDNFQSKGKSLATVPNQPYHQIAKNQFSKSPKIQKTNVAEVKFLQLASELKKKKPHEIVSFFSLCCKNVSMNLTWNIKEHLSLNKKEPPVFKCKLFCDEILLSSEIARRKQEAKCKAFESAYRNLLNPYVKIVFNNVEGCDEIICSDQPFQQANSNDNQGVKRKINPRIKFKRFRTADDMVIVDRCDGTDYLHNPKKILMESASFCKVNLKFKINGVKVDSKKQFKCTVFIGKKEIGSAVNTKTQQATLDAAEVALKHLRTFLPTVQIKSLIDEDTKEIQRGDLIVGDTNKINEFIPDDNIGNKMLRKMGWVTGGVGRDGNKGIEEPINVTPNFCKREGFGLENRKTAPREFIAIMEKVIQNYVTGESREDLVFSSDFTKEERAAIHVIANRYHLKNVSRGKGDKRYLTLSIRRNPAELIQYLNEQGGEAGKYKLIQAESV